MVSSPVPVHAQGKSAALLALGFLKRQCCRGGVGASVDDGLWTAAWGVCHICRALGSDHLTFVRAFAQCGGGGICLRDDSRSLESAFLGYMI